MSTSELSRRRLKVHTSDPKHPNANEKEQDSKVSDDDHQTEMAEIAQGEAGASDNDEDKEMESDQTEMAEIPQGEDNASDNDEDKEMESDHQTQMAEIRPGEAHDSEDDEDEEMEDDRQKEMAGIPQGAAEIESLLSPTFPMDDAEIDAEDDSDSEWSKHPVQAVFLPAFMSNVES